MKRIPESLWCELKNVLPVKNTKAGRPEFDNKKTIVAREPGFITRLSFMQITEQFLETIF